MFAIKATKRDLKVKLDTLRKGGEIPAVFYGLGKVSTSISIPTIAFKKVLREAGESSAVKVSMTDSDIDEPIHVDFLAIDMNKKIRVKVALVFEGVSNAVKSGIGNLVKVLHEIEVEALPKDLPHNLVADISSLETLDNNILVSDIKLPSGVVVVTNGGDVVASVVAQVEEKEEIVVPVDLTAIEVEKKGKKDEEGVEGEAATPVPEEKVEKKTDKK